MKHMVLTVSTVGMTTKRKRGKDMGIVKNLTGQRFGKLTAIEIVGTSNDRHKIWRCICDCGKETLVKANALTTGRTKSCGCLRFDIGDRRRTHGGSSERLFMVWEGMRARCNSPSCRDYRYYGAKGVRICEEWNDYGAFREWALANGYDPTASFGDYTIDRIDPHKNYEPSNCRWIPNSEQWRTMRRNYKEYQNG